MGRKVPTGIQEFSDLDVGNYHFNVENFEEKFTQTDNLLMYSAQLGVLAPKERANRKHFENFVIGTKEDPQAELEETWKKTAGRMKSFCKACGFDMEGLDMDVVISHAMRKNLCARIEHRPGKGEYAGRTFVNVAKWAMEGLMEPMLDPVEAPVHVPTPIATQAPVAPVAQPVPTPITPVAPQAPQVAPEVPFVPPIPPAPGQ